MVGQRGYRSPLVGVVGVIQPVAIGVAASGQAIRLPIAVAIMAFGGIGCAVVVAVGITRVGGSVGVAVNRQIPFGQVGNAIAVIVAGVTVGVLIIDQEIAVVVNAVVANLRAELGIERRRVDHAQGERQQQDEYDCSLHNFATHGSAEERFCNAGRSTVAAPGWWRGRWST